MEFINCIADTLARIGEIPEAYEVVFEDVRRTVVQQFPYFISYRIEQQQIVVLAISHSKRDPKNWQSRV